MLFACPLRQAIRLQTDHCGEYGPKRSDATDCETVRPVGRLSSIADTNRRKEIVGAWNGTGDIHSSALEGSAGHSECVLESFQTGIFSASDVRSVYAVKPVQSRTMKVEDTGLVEIASPSRGYRPLALVTEVSGGESSDWKKRTCTIRIPSGKEESVIEMKRPIQLLHPVETTRN